MSLDNLKLSPYLVTKMYEHSLISSGDNQLKEKGDKVIREQRGKEGLKVQQEEKDKEAGLREQSRKENKGVAKNADKSPGQKAEADSSFPKNIAALGDNKRHILITVDEKEQAFLTDVDLEFLVAVLNACGVTPEDVAVVNCHNNPAVSYENLNAQFTPEIILFMGTEPHLLGFPIQIPRYRIQHYNQQQYICTPSLQELAADKDEKKQLWSLLKTIFSIS